ncbi:AMP-dependent synthetase/ligase [Pyrobaculum ferrireducens]|uniref:ABC transporter ATP-binding component n=1 Tax=Pyrobaculum ferrireducens TaxID=1104324 RepID=G7VCG4_9CREN|nr:AMP-binding protein [Pyrobaculum ferrireducens]AET32584.1 ABC transporter ATP-binding component [Pyrobaculum ferrireducens]
MRGRRPWEGLRGETFPKILLERGEAQDAVAIREKSLGVWRPYTWGEYLDKVREFAYGLLALGFRPGEHLAVVGFNRPFLLFAEVAAMALHGKGVGVYPDLLPEERAYWLDYTDSVVVVAEDQEQVDKILAVARELPKLRAIVYWDDRMMWRYEKRIGDVALLSWDEVVKMGREAASTEPGLFEKMAESTSPDDVCLLLSTSGTTGKPKAVMLTYSSMLSMAKNLWEVDPIWEDFEYVSYLPFAWVGEQMMSLAMHMLVGFRLNFVEEPDTLWRDFREIAPHFMFGPARVYEMFYSKIYEHIEDATPLGKAVFKWAINVAEKRAEMELKKARIPPALRLQWWVAYWLVYRSLLDKLGLKRIRYAYVGGSFLGPDYLKFFRGIGVNLKRIWGMTEVSGIATVHRNDDVRLDTVGAPIANTEIKIAEDGEILVRTPAVMAGYYKREDATAEVLRDGWLYTGDVGMLTEDGHLIYLGRKEDVQRLADGTVFSALFIENMLKYSPYVKEALVYGEGRPYVVAILNINFETVSKWAEQRGIAYTSYQDLSQKDAVYELLRGVVARVNSNLPEKLRIRKFTSLFKEFHPDDGEMTRTRKLRRVFIHQRYSNLLEAMYKGDEMVELTVPVKYEDGTVRDVTMAVKIVTL